MAEIEREATRRENWLPDVPHVEAEIVETGGKFEFFQAVRLLERTYLPTVRPGETGALSKEPIRFRSYVGFDFPSREIDKIEGGHTLSPDARVTVSARFMGVLGPLGLGSLPNPYTELVLDRLRERDDRLRDFYDIFNHRLIGLFYAAWTKRHPAAAHEQGRARAGLHAGESEVEVERAREVDWPTFIVRCLVGLGTHLGDSDVGVAEDLLLYNAASFALDRMPPASIESVLQSYFQVPFEVVSFQGRWYDLEPQEKTQVGSTCSVALGDGLILGDSVWSPSAGMRLRVGPVGFQQFRSFLPHAPAFNDLKRIVSILLGHELEVDIQLVLKRDEVPQFSLVTESTPGAPSPYLGWSSWLGAPALDHDSDDALFSLDVA